MKNLLLLVVFIASAARAADPWSNADIARQAAASLLILTDWGQTRYIATHPLEFSEDDRFIFGKHPSIGKVNTRYGLSFVLNPVVTNYLPEKYRPVWQWGTIGIEGYCTSHNFSVGVKVQF